MYLSVVMAATCIGARVASESICCTELLVVMVERKLLVKFVAI